MGWDFLFVAYSSRRDDGSSKLSIQGTEHGRGVDYSAPDPKEPPFVKVGDKVRQGQVLCIVEAMKLMNEIDSEYDGEIVDIHLENGQAVQYGDPLFSIKPVKTDS